MLGSLFVFWRFDCVPPKQDSRILASLRILHFYDIEGFSRNVDWVSIDVKVLIHVYYSCVESYAIVEKYGFTQQEHLQSERATTLVVKSKGSAKYVPQIIF